MTQNIKTIIATLLLLFLFKSASALWPSELVKHSNAQFIDGDNAFTPFVAQKRRIANKKRTTPRKDTINRIVYLPVYIPTQIVSYYPVYIPIFIPTNF